MNRAEQTSVTVLVLWKHDRPDIKEIFNIQLLLTDIYNK